MKANEQQSEKLTSKLKNMVKMFPVANSMLKKDAQHSGKKKSDSEDYGSFDINGLNHKPIEDCDHLFDDCNNFLKLAKETIEFTTQSGAPSKLLGALGSGLGGRINKWRAKRKGNHLFMLFESLQERIEASETQLKTLNEDSQRNSSSLILQSLHLKVRLKACIEYNRVISDELKPIIVEATTLHDHFLHAEHAVHSMITFYDELQTITNNQPYIPWAMRSANEDEHHKKIRPVNREKIVRRYNKLKKVRLLIEHNLDVISRRYDSHYANYNHCSRVLHSMNKLLQKIATHNFNIKHNISPTMTNNPIKQRTLSGAEAAATHDTNSSSGASSTEVVEVKNPAMDSSRLSANLESSTTTPVIHKPSDNIDDEEFLATNLGECYEKISPYDHVHCSDCSCVYSMANECLMHLAASQHQAQECMLRLNKLVMDIKERLKEDADKLESLDWGGHNHVHLA